VLLICCEFFALMLPGLTRLTLSLFPPLPSLSNTLRPGPSSPPFPLTSPRPVARPHFPHPTAKSLFLSLSFPKTPRRVFFFKQSFLSSTYVLLAPVTGRSVALFFLTPPHRRQGSPYAIRGAGPRKHPPSSFPLTSFPGAPVTGTIRPPMFLSPTRC